MIQTNKLANQQRNALADLEDKQAQRIASEYAKAYRQVKPLINAMVQQTGLVDGGMTGREIVETAAFRELMQKTLDVFGAFGAKLYEVTKEGITDAVALGANDCVDLMLQNVAESDKAKAKAMINPVDQKDLLDRLGVTNA